MRVPLSLVLSLAAAAAASPALAQPQRRDGLWEMTMKMSSPAPATMTMRQCTDPNEEKKGAAFRTTGPQAAGMDCTPGATGPAPGGGWRYSSTCKMQGMTMTSTGVARGDFRTGYHMETTTRMSPAPMPQLAEQKMTIDAKWIGPCPADMKPGDMVMNGRKISARTGR